MQLQDVTNIEYRLIAGTLAVALGCVALFACGWYISGWRLGKEVAEKETEITRLEGELGKQNLAYELLAKEAQQRQRDAKIAQVEAAILRKRFSDKARELSTNPASSCADVLRDNWGRS